MKKRNHPGEEWKITKVLEPKLEEKCAIESDCCCYLLVCSTNIPAAYLSPSRCTPSKHRPQQFLQTQTPIYWFQSIVSPPGFFLHLSKRNPRGHNRKKESWESSGERAKHFRLSGCVVPQQDHDDLIAPEQRPDSLPSSPARW